MILKFYYTQLQQVKADSLMTAELDLESSASDSMSLVAVRFSNKPICLEVEDILLQDLLKKIDSYVTLVSALPMRKQDTHVIMKTLNFQQSFTCQTGILRQKIRIFMKNNLVLIILLHFFVL